MTYPTDPPAQHTRRMTAKQRAMHALMVAEPDRYWNADELAAVTDAPREGAVATVSSLVARNLAARHKPRRGPVTWRARTIEGDRP